MLQSDLRNLPKYQYKTKPAYTNIKYTFLNSYTPFFSGLATEKGTASFANCSFNSCVEQCHKDSVREATAEYDPSYRTLLMFVHRKKRNCWRPWEAACRRAFVWPASRGWVVSCFRQWPPEHWDTLPTRRPGPYCGPPGTSSLACPTPLLSTSPLSATVKTFR